MADSRQVNVQTQQGCTTDDSILIDRLIYSFKTHHSEMGRTLIIASFEAQSIRMVSSETMKKIVAKKRRTDEEISKELK